MRAELNSALEAAPIDAMKPSNLPTDTIFLARQRVTIVPLWPIYYLAIRPSGSFFTTTPSGVA